MTYTVKIERLAQKQLAKLEKGIGNAIYKKLLALEENPRPPGCKKLQGSNAWRIRMEITVWCMK